VIFAETAERKVEASSAKAPSFRQNQPRIWDILRTRKTLEGDAQTKNFCVIDFK